MANGGMPRTSPAHTDLSQCNEGMKGLRSKSGWCGTDVLWCLRLLMYVRYGVSSHLCCTHLQVFVSPGDTVAKGDTLITVEGMKMEVSRDSSF